MSAIFGILRFDDSAVNPRELERMSNTLARRGPDRQKFAVNGRIGLGQCLLLVNAEDRFEAQPLYDRETDTTLVADARIDNRETLADTFGWSADDCKERPDSVFIQEAYKRWGEDAAAHLLGYFVFAIWDGRTRKLVLARDHMGQRSLLYHRNKDFLAFASSEKALWAVGDVPRALSMKNFTSLVIEDQNRERGSTIFEGIRGICGGSTTIADASGRVSVRTYWEPRPDPVHVGHDLDYYVAAYRRVLEEAVTCRVRRTIHSAALFFSGGFDSTAIAGLAGAVLRAQGRKLLAVCSGMPAGHEFAQKNGLPRIAWCRRLMPHLDIRYVEPDVGVITDGLDQVFANVERPLGFSKLLDNALYLCATQAGARLVMDGHGGDYTLNPTGAGTLAYFVKTGRLRRFLTEFGAWRRYRQRSFFRTLVVDVALKLVWAPVAGGLLALRAREPVFGLRTPVTKHVLQLAKAAGAKPFSVVRLAARGGKMKRFGNVLRAIQGAANSPASNAPAGCAFDFSRPFHDKRVIELALAIPEEFDVIEGRARALARRALADIFPPEFDGIEKGLDSTAPDLGRMVQVKLPLIAAELGRLEANQRLAQFLDFPAIRRIAHIEATREVNSSQSVSHTVRTYLVARYLEWFDRGNC